MPNIVPASQQISQMLSVYRQMREAADPGPTGGEMWRAQQEEQRVNLAYKERARQVSENKTLMSMMLQNYQQAKDDPFLREHLQRAMMDLHDRLPPEMRGLMEAFTKNTPGSKEAYKRTMWLNANKAPSITATWEDDPHARAHQEFQMSDWRDRFGATFGKGGKAPAKSLLPTGLTTKVGDKEESLYAYRGEDGMAELLTSNELGLGALAKRLDVNLAELITNGGVYSKQENVTEINGERIVTKDFTSIQALINSSGRAGMTKSVEVKREVGQLPPESKAQGRYLKEMERMKTDLRAIQAGDEKNHIARIVRLLSESAVPSTPEYVIENILKPNYDIPLLQFYHKGDFDRIGGQLPWVTTRDWAILGIRGGNPGDWFGFHGYSDVGNVQFGFFQGAQATDTKGKALDFYWRQHRDGKAYLCDVTGNRIPPDKVEGLVKKFDIGDAGVDYTNQGGAK